jgi:hypothetical protein
VRGGLTSRCWRLLLLLLWQPAERRVVLVKGLRVRSSLSYMTWLLLLWVRVRSTERWMLQV